MSIIEQVRANLDPDRTANALYETMVLWHSTHEAMKVSSGKQYLVLLGRRQAYERTVAIFTGANRHHVRNILKAHFDRPAGEMDAR